MNSPVLCESQHTSRERLVPAPCTVPSERSLYRLVRRAGHMNKPLGRAYGLGLCYLPRNLLISLLLFYVFRHSQTHEMPRIITPTPHLPSIVLPFGRVSFCRRVSQHRFRPFTTLGRAQSSLSPPFLPIPSSHPRYDSKSCDVGTAARSSTGPSTIMTRVYVT